MVSIIVYSFDGDERLSLCTQALQDAYGGDHEVIQAPSRGPRGRELTMPEAFNRGASSASGEYLAFVTADTVAAPGWLERLLACAEATGAGAVGPMCNMAAGLQNAPAPMASDEATPAPDPSKWRATVRIAIAPMLVRKDTFLDLGGFDERFGQGGFADDDFCLRLARAGLKAYIAKDAYVHRAGPRHPQHGEPERVKVLDAEARRMCSKWGLDDPMAAHPRRDVLTMIEPEGKNILDLRARAGATLLECMERGARSVTGIEEDRRLRAVASTYLPGTQDYGARVAKNLKEAASSAPYDAIISVWHLECLPNPIGYLRRLRSVLAPGGVLLACVRNAWALSRLLPLLLTAPPPTYPRPAWGPCAAPDDVMRWFDEAGYAVTGVKTAYAPPLGKEPFLDSFLRLCKNHGFMDDPRPEFYSDECWFTANVGSAVST
jgi:2-polyprenyl-3-methyl-5-hydroxy-6-metoxy-1,4-benzoquinol methylase